MAVSYNRATGVEVLPSASRAAATYTTGPITVPNGVSYAKLVVSVTTLGGSGTVDAKLQTSDDNSSYSDLTSGAIAQITGSASSKESTFAAVTHPYLQVSCTVGTAASTFSVAVIFF